MNELLKKDDEFIWHPFTPLLGSPAPLAIRSAKGIYLHTHDGRKIIDAVSSWWVNLHGHSHPHIAQAMSEQVNVLDHVIFAGFTHEPAIKLSENLLHILPSNQSKIFFSDNGSTAVEVGLKMALQYWRNRGIERKQVIALRGAYHGDTFGAMSVGERGMFTSPFTRYLFDVSFIDFPEAHHQDFVLDQFEKLVKSDDVAVFIFEPLVQAASGMKMYSPAVLDRLMQIARQHEVICIADEVFTGFGRTGKLFASDYLHEQPDIIALSKGITGGTMPLGVTSCSTKIIEAFHTAEFSKTFFHGHSYTANPIACAVANASYELLLDEKCQKQINMIGAHHHAFCKHIGRNAKVKNARCLGTIAAIELKTIEGWSYDNEMRKKIYRYFLERNILLRPLGNTIYILPPYIITSEELQIIYNCIEAFLDIAD